MTRNSSTLHDARDGLTVAFKRFTAHARVVFVLGLVSLINSLTSGKKKQVVCAMA